MATVARDIPRMLTVEEFLDIDWGEQKVELNNGAVYMMAGGTIAHARVGRNILVALFTKLRGSGCIPLGSDAGLRPHDFSLRYPDVAVYCGEQTHDDNAKALREPKAVFEVLSDGTARSDLTTKLGEYKLMPSLDTIVFVDIGRKTFRILQRDGISWLDGPFAARDAVELPTLGVMLTVDEIFSRD